MNAGLAEELSRWPTATALPALVWLEWRSLVGRGQHSEHRMRRAIPDHFVSPTTTRIWPRRLTNVPWAKSLVVVSYDYLARADTPSQEGAVVGRFATANQYEGVRRITEATAAHSSIGDSGPRFE